MLCELAPKLSECLSCEGRRPGAVVADLKIARGLDYYTGTVYESFMTGYRNILVNNCFN